ncbi:MAG: DUF86 domain-containing protein [Anaerolineae bacterium]|nr:DUF86 domain-containing protein [Anaerolineae bacterium]
MTDDKVHLIYIRECIVNIEDLTAQGRDAFMVAKHDQAAALYYLQTLAESTQRLSEPIKAAYPEIDWTAISGFRNRLAHGYLSVNMAIVWNVIENYLPPLKQAVDAMLQDLDNSTA